MLDQSSNSVLNDQRLPEHSKFWTSSILCKISTHNSGFNLTWSNHNPQSLSFEHLLLG